MCMNFFAGYEREQLTASMLASAAAMNSQGNQMVTDSNSAFNTRHTVPRRPVAATPGRVPRRSMMASTGRGRGCQRIDKLSVILVCVFPETQKVTSLDHKKLHDAGLGIYCVF